MDINIRQQEAVDAMRHGKVAEIDRGESVRLNNETYPAAMFDKLASMGLCVRRGDGDRRFWAHK